MAVGLVWPALACLAGASSGCGLLGQAPSFPEGEWLLSGRNVDGELRSADDGISISLRGERWATRRDADTPIGLVEARLVEDQDGGTWIHFPIETGLALGEAALHIDHEHQRALLPLGAREGEFDLVLAMEPGLRAPGELQLATAAAADRLDEARETWRVGDFKLLNGHKQLVGTLSFSAEPGPMIEIFDPAMMTPGLVRATREDEGAEIILVFDVEPSLQGEGALFRLNVPTQRAILPLQRQPHPDDRWFYLEPGVPEPEASAAAREDAARLALEKERSLLLGLGPALAREATATLAETGACPDLPRTYEHWGILLADYQVEVQQAGRECRVALTTKTPQHTRRMRGVFSPGGPLELDPVEAP